MPIEEIATLDAVLRAYAAELGDDFTAYRNHTYRVVNLCVALSAGAAGQLEKIAIAAAFHDLGIWTDRTFDYLGPSTGLACAHLAHVGQTGWEREISGMIQQHHQISRYRDEGRSLVEPFRRADWVDISRGLLSFGLPRELLRDIFRTWPDAGFHKRLLQLSLRRLRTHPWSPLPMLKF